MQPLPRVAQTYTTSVRSRGRRHTAFSIIDYAQHHRIAFPRTFDHDASTLRGAFDAVLDGILHERLEDERGDPRVQHRIVDMYCDAQSILEAHLHDVHVEPEQVQLAPKRYLGFPPALEAVTKQVAQPSDHAPHSARIALHERR